MEPELFVSFAVSEPEALSLHSATFALPMPTSRASEKGALPSPSLIRRPLYQW